MMRIIALIFGMLLMPFFIHAQVSQGGKPISFTNQFSKNGRANIDSRVVQTPDLSKISQYKNESIDGIGVEVGFSLNNSGTWNKLEDGSKLWRLEISSPGAKDLSVTFKNFELKGKSKLYVYSCDKSDVVGAFSSQNNNRLGIFAVAPIEAECIIIEYFEPVEILSSPNFSIEQVIYGFDKKKMK